MPKQCSKRCPTLLRRKAELTRPAFLITSFMVRDRGRRHHCNAFRAYA
jgi:hypothetical protein